MSIIRGFELNDWLVLEGNLEYKKKDFIGKEVECPEIRRPVVMNQSSSKREQSAEDLLDSINPPNSNKRRKGYEKGQKSDSTYFNQPGKFLSILIMSLRVDTTFEHIVLEYEYKKGYRAIQVNMLEVEQHWVD